MKLLKLYFLINLLVGLALLNPFSMATKITRLKYEESVMRQVIQISKNKNNQKVKAGNAKTKTKTKQSENQRKSLIKYNANPSAYRMLTMYG